MDDVVVQSAIDALRSQHENLNWSIQQINQNGHMENIMRWPGSPNEEIMITIHQSRSTQAPFHRHDFFFFEYAYHGQHDALSYPNNSRITIRENEIYAAQPFSGYSLVPFDNDKVTVISILIQKSTFYKTYLPLFMSNSSLFQFFVHPTTDQFSEEFIHLKMENTSVIRNLLEMMVLEYANKRPDTQDVLKPMALTFLMYVARQYADSGQAPAPSRLSDKILQYMGSHPGDLTIKDIAHHFSYNPNYISTVLNKELGCSFSQIRLTQRMELAAQLLKGTDMTIEEIYPMVGCKSSSNFYKSFREYHGCTPREYVRRNQSKEK